MMLESELIIAVTNVGCLRLWVCVSLSVGVCFCLLGLFSARRSALRQLVRGHKLFPTFSAANVPFFTHMEVCVCVCECVWACVCVFVLTAECVRSPERVNLQQINTDVEKRGSSFSPTGLFPLSAATHVDEINSKI